MWITSGDDGITDGPTGRAVGVFKQVKNFRGQFRDTRSRICQDMWVPDEAAELVCFGGGYGFCCFGVRDLEFDFDVLAFASDVITGDGSRCRCAQYRSARDVVHGTVPRARHFCVHNHSLGKRATFMGTGVVNRIERSVDVEERDSLTPSFHCPRLTRSDLAGFCDFHELGHRAPPGGFSIARWFRSQRSAWPRSLPGAMRSRTSCLSSLLSGKRPSFSRDQTSSPSTRTSKTPPVPEMSASSPMSSWNVSRAPAPSRLRAAATCIGCSIAFRHADTSVLVSSWCQCSLGRGKGVLGSVLTKRCVEENSGYRFLPLPGSIGLF